MWARLWGFLDWCFFGPATRRTGIASVTVRLLRYPYAVVGDLSSGELNPRLGCWGPRPDLVEAGLAESDCAIAVILGLSIYLPGADPPVDDQVFLEAVRDTLLEALSYWVVVAQRTAGPQDRNN